MYRLVLFLLFCSCYALSAQITFRPAGGIYSDEGVQITMQAEAGERIYYTLDGSRPDARSLTYEAGERLDFYQTTVIRAIAINAAGKEVGIGGTTYLVGEPESKLAIVSVGIDSRRLFDPVRGWFVAGPRADKDHWQLKGANFWTHDEYPGHLDLYEPDGSTIFRGQVGYRIFGGMSRLHPQKSLSVSWRKKYGAKELEYPIFGEQELDHFKYLVFRNGGSDWSRSHLRDVVMSDLLQDESWDLDHQANRPARLFINGKYWGLYHIREKINRSFVADHRGYHRDSLDLLEHQETIKAGSDLSWQQTLQFFQKHWYFDNQKMAEARGKIDVDNFMRLQIAQLYFDNRDAGGNIRYYRPHKPDRLGKQQWRWILYDLDYGMGLHDPASYAANTLALLTANDGPDWPNPPWSTLLQRRLLTNPDYRTLFVNRSLDYLQTDFSTGAVRQTILEHAESVETEMPRALERWKLSEKYWRLHLARLLEFADKRPGHVREHLRTYFKGGADRLLTLQQNEGGHIRLNENIYLRSASWSGHYFSAHPVSIRAVPEPGYRFVGWEDMEGRRSFRKLDLSQESEHIYKARFEENGHELSEQIMITEVAAGGSDGQSWVEIYNNSEEEVNLRDWLLIWDKTRIRLPSHQLKARSYIVLCEDSQALNAEFLLVNKVAKAVKELSLTKGLPQKIGLYSARGAYVDLIELPERTGDASSIFLAANHLDNGLAENWMKAKVGGESPGRAPEVGLMAFHIRYNQFWERLGIACLLIVVGWRYLRRYPRGE